MFAVPEIAPPVLNPLPVHDEAQAEPPETDQVTDVVPPASIVLSAGVTEEVQAATSTLLHVAEVVCPEPASVTVSDACFVPGVA